MVVEIKDLIELVRQRRCLWDWSNIGYKNGISKNEVWDDVARQCGLKRGILAKRKWKRIRDCYRLAMRRRRLAKSGISKPWQYENEMSFINPYMQSRMKATNAIIREDKNETATRVETPAPQSPIQTDSPSSPESDCSDQETPEESEELQDNGQEDEQSIRNEIQKENTTNRNDVREEKSTENQISTETRDGLGLFFDCLYEKTRNLPGLLQLRVQRELMNSVLTAEEEALAMKENGRQFDSRRKNTASNGMVRPRGKNNAVQQIDQNSRRANASEQTRCDQIKYECEDNDLEDDYSN